jgi:hypothetical protein
MDLLKSFIISLIVFIAIIAFFIFLLNEIFMIAIFLLAVFIVVWHIIHNELNNKW